jgi:hypothetical protein
MSNGVSARSLEMGVRFESRIVAKISDIRDTEGLDSGSGPSFSMSQSTMVPTG